MAGFGSGLRVRWYSSLFLFVVVISCNKKPKTNKTQTQAVKPLEYVLPPEFEPLVEQIDSLVNLKIRLRAFNGVVLVADYGNIIYKKAYGFANFKTKEKLKEHSVFQLASVSKMFTAAAIMKLHEKKKLHFNDKVNQYLPLFPYPEVTIRNLLNHRSGLPRYMVTSDEYWPRDSMMNNTDMHNLMVDYCPEPYYKPDQRFNYQNTNYAYLALLVESISGKKFGEFCRDEIFEPLKMYDTKVFHGKDSTDIPGAVLGHIYRRPRPLSPYENYINGVVGDKGVYSSVFDLLKFDQALYDQKFFPDSILNEAFKPGSPEKKSNRENYGFGWRISPFEKDKLVFHYGWWNGFKTCFMRFMKSRRTIIVLTNRDRSLTLPKEIQNLMFPETKP
jgi:CubicO group peptidase (beta-lactamase class C family)